MAAANVKQIKDYFEMSLPEFKREWLALPEKDRKEIAEGIGNGSLTY